MQFVDCGALALQQHQYIDGLSYSLNHYTSSLTISSLYSAPNEVVALLKDGDFMYGTTCKLFLVLNYYMSSYKESIKDKSDSRNMVNPNRYTSIIISMAVLPCGYHLGLQVRDRSIC